MCKKLTALCMALCMVICMLTVPVMAEDSVGDPTADLINGILKEYFYPYNPYGGSNGYEAPIENSRLEEQHAILEEMRAEFDTLPLTYRDDVSYLAEEDNFWYDWAEQIIADSPVLWDDVEQSDVSPAGVIHRYFLLEAIYLANNDDEIPDFELKPGASAELEADFAAAMDELEKIFTHDGDRDYNDLWGYSFEECLEPFNHLENDASNLYIFLFGDGYQEYYEASDNQDYFLDEEGNEKYLAIHDDEFNKYQGKPAVATVKALYTTKLAKLIHDACRVFYTAPSVYEDDVEEMIGTENRKILGITFGKEIFNTFSNSGENGFDDGLLDGYVQNFKKAVIAGGFGEITDSYSAVLKGTQAEALPAAYDLLSEFLDAALDTPVRETPDPDKPNSFGEVMDAAGIDMTVAVDIHKAVGAQIDNDDQAYGRIVALNLLLGRFMDVFENGTENLVDENGLRINLPYKTMQTDRFDVKINAEDITNSNYPVSTFIDVKTEPSIYNEEEIEKYASKYAPKIVMPLVLGFTGTTAYNTLYDIEGHRDNADGDDIYSYLRTYRLATGAEKVLLNPVEKTIYVNTSFVITHNIKPDSSAEWLVWESEDPSIAVVDAEGRVIGVRVGTTTITAKTQAGDVISECIVTVIKRQGPTGGGGGGFISDEDAATIIEAAVNGSGLYQPKPAEGERGTHRAYIKGYPDGLVRPGGYITRAELAMILHRLSDDFKPKGGQQFYSFPDVPHEFWAAIAIYDVNQKGWMTGYPDGTFRPDDYLTRAEFVTALQRATGVVFSTKSTGLTDVAGHWAEKYITTANYYGFVTGYPDNTFRPENTIIRAEAMAIVNRIIGRAPEHDDIEDIAESLFPDLDPSFWGFADVMEAILYHDFVMGPVYEDWQVVHDGYIGY